MLAAEHDRKLLIVEDGGDDPANLRHDVAHVVVRKLHFGQGVDADRVDVGAGFLVPQLQMR